MPAYKSVTIAYFSGTGGTKLVAECLKQQCNALGIHTNMECIPSAIPGKWEETDLFIVLSPVYAFRLVSLVEDWISKLPKTTNTPAVVLSVSAGGEVSPNTACRVRSKRLLQRKGYSVIYETMLVMPSNFVVQTPPDLAKQIIAVLPHKVSAIVSDLLAKQKRITRPKLQDRCFSILGRGEHLGARFFGKSLHVTKACTQCGLCEKQCPAQNITEDEGTYHFGFRCIMCLKCVYQCPAHAIKSRFFSVVILKEGYDIHKVAEATTQKEAGKKQGRTEALVWKGVIDYLQEEIKTVDASVEK